MRVVFNEAFFAVFAAVLTLCQFFRFRPRPALQAPRTNSEAPCSRSPSLGVGVEEADLHSQRRVVMRVDWRWLWTECATAAMTLCVAESATQMIVYSFARATHVHLALGLSKGFALLIITLIVVAQIVASVALLLPAIYLKTGSVVPSGALALTLWFEACVFGDATDTAFILRSASLTATACMLALFRFDRQARNAMAQLPTSGTLLNIEATVRRGSTAACTGLVCPPCAIIVTLWAVWANPFWRTSGILYEWYRGRFQAGLAISSLLFVLGAQDTRAHTWLRWATERLFDKTERVVDFVLRRKDTLLGQQSPFRPIGRKKNL